MRSRHATAGAIASCSIARRRSPAALEARDVEVVALAADNGPAWLAVDLAAQICGAVLVPLPPYFTREQIAHALADSGADALLADPRLLARRDSTAAHSSPSLALGDELAFGAAARESGCRNAAGHGQDQLHVGHDRTNRKACACAQSSMDTVADSLRGAVAELGVASASVRAAARDAAREHRAVSLRRSRTAPRSSCRAPSRRASPAQRASTRPHCCAASIGYRPESIILVPQLLARARRGARARRAAADEPQARRRRRRPRVAGAARARRSPRATRLRRLRPHGVRVRRRAEHARGAPQSAASAGRCRTSTSRSTRAARSTSAAPAVSGYVGGEHVPQRFATGDLGHLDADGFLHVNGRRKNLFITSFGRNVSPEWVEAELAEEPLDRASSRIRRGAAVERRGHRPGRGRRTRRHASRDRRRQPSPARLRARRRLARGRRALHARNGQLTTNGRNRRAAIWNRYRWSARRALRPTARPHRLTQGAFMSFSTELRVPRPRPIGNAC